MSGLTHIAEDGSARMVDVGDKSSTTRRAVAEANVRMQAATLTAILEGDVKKGDVLGAARLAGIMGAKRTADLVPLCHPIALSSVDVRIEATEDGLRVETEIRCDGRTGVEMEALTAAMIAALTIYDMAKALDRGMTIDGVRVLSKSGGQSGDWSVLANDAST